MSEEKRLQRILKTARNVKQKYAAQEDLAEYFFGNGEYHQALDYYEASLESALALNDEEKIAKAHRMIGEVQVELCEYEEALSHTNKYLDYASAKEERIIELQRAHTTLGRTYLVQADSMPDKNSLECRNTYKKATECLWRSLQSCEKLEKKIPSGELNDMRARSILNLGLTYEGLGKFDEAIEQLFLAIRLCRKHKIDSTLIRCCVSLGSLYARQGEYDKAFRMYQEANGSVKSLPEKERVKPATDILCLEAEGYLFQGDVHSARRALQKAYAMLKPCHSSNAVVVRLKTVAAMDIEQRKSSNSDLSPEDRFEIYDRLGDGFVTCGCSELALQNYKKALDYAKISNMNLKPCYVSLAQTCKDLKHYDKAILYFKEEFKFCDTPEDKCDSLLNIQECQAFLNVSSAEQSEILIEAWNLVKESKSTGHQRAVLKRQEKLYSASGDQKLAETAARKLKAFGDDSDEESEIEEGTPNIGEYIDVDVLSDLSEDEEEGIHVSSSYSVPDAPRPSRRNPSRARPSVARRNEKGETKLHIACINGNRNAAMTLLGQGFDVNATDHAGWTPLHEACNHGHIEVVDLLLERGADVNAKASGDITPLYDAAQAGNFEVSEKLLDHNASVEALTEKGESALDGLMKFYEDNHLDLTNEEKEQYNCLKDRLTAKMEMCGVSLKSTTNNEQSTFQAGKIRATKQSKSCMGRLRRIVNDDDDDDLLVSHRKRTMRDISPVAPSPTKSLGDVWDVEEGGVSEYISAIQGLKPQPEAGSTEQVRQPLQPLVSEGEVEEDWLDDDMPARKRRKSDQPNLSSTYKPLSLKKKKSASRLSLSRPSSTEPCENTRWSTGSRESRGSRHSDVLETSFRHSDVDEAGPATHNEIAQDFDNIWCNMDPVDSCPDVFQTPIRPRQTSLLSHVVTLSPSPTFSQPSQAISQPPTILPSFVNVRVEKHLFAIYVENPSLSIGWLAEEASKRYKKEHGCQPILSIFSMDGAQYSNEDPVKMVIGGDVEGRVKSWNDTSIIERYEEACKVLSCEIDHDISSLLEASQLTHSLDIINTMFHSQVLKPVFKAISLERNLSKINLPNNRIDDDGIMDLCINFGKLCKITELDFSGNNISAQGVAEIARAAKNGDLQGLMTFNLSHNNLGNASLPFLAEITASVPHLQSLYLSDCMFTKSIWEGNNHCLTLNKIQILDLSYNPLHAKGLAGFLGFYDNVKERRLNPERLQTLHLIGVSGERLCQEVLLFLEKGNSIALRELHLSYVGMQDDELLQLLSILRSAPDLHTICLPHALDVKSRTVCELLLHQPPLKRLEVGTRKGVWDEFDETTLVDAILKAAKSHLEILSLRDLPTAAVNLWCQIRGESSVRRGASNLMIMK